MSIINDALKKARRQNPDPQAGSPESENQPLQPKKRAGSRSTPKQHYAGLILVVLFLGLVGALGYVLYTEYLAEPDSSNTVAEEKPARDPKRKDAASGDAKETPEVRQAAKEEPTATEESADPAPAPPAAGRIRISSDQPAKRPAQPVEQSKDPKESPAVAADDSAGEDSASATVQRAPASLLSQISINGVMRSSAGDRILTNSGVYRIGDTLAAPSGYRIAEINETEVILEGPGSRRYAVPLP